MEAGGLLPRQSQQPGPPGPNQLQSQVVNNINQQQQQLQQEQLHQNLQLQHQQQMGQAPEILPRGKQVTTMTVERLRRRIEGYRRRQSDLEPKFDQSFHGICEQGIQETLLLKQRFVDNNKAKRQPKKNDKKQNDTVVSTTLSNNIHVQQKFLKRTTDDLESTGNNETNFGEPPVKLQCTQSSNTSIAHQSHVQQQSNNSVPNTASGNNVGGGAASGTQPSSSNKAPGGASNNSSNENNGGNSTSEGLNKFTVEIVQQVEFTTSAVNSQAQQISTNVTVKALTNASVKSDLINSSSPIKTEQSTTASTPSNNSSTAQNSGSTSGNNASATINPSADIINSLVECKQEPDNDFDLEQCAAAIEKDGFPGFVVDFMNDEAGDEDPFKDLISEISDLHPQMEFIKDLDFEEKQLDGLNNGINIKLEDNKERVHSVMQQQSQQQQQGSLAAQYSSAVNRITYSGLDFKSELNPAAQTLKQMAEQHQHKNQQLSGSGFNSSVAGAAAARAPNSRSPYSDFNQFTGVTSEYLNNSQGSITQVPPNVSYKNNSSNSVPVPFQTQPSDNIFGQQQRSTQNNASSNKSTNIMGSSGPTGPTGTSYKQQYSPYGSPGSMPNHGSPGYPLPSRISQGTGHGSSSQGGFSSSTPPRPPSGPGASNIQINQAQQLHINSPHQIQVSAGQHMQLTSELKPGNISVAAQQGIYFNQQQQSSQAQQQQGGASTQNETYCSVSQSQTINFTQQSLRQRPTATGGTGTTQQQTRAHPGQPQSSQSQQPQQQHSVSGSSLSEPHHAKLIQQQMMRAQQQQLQQLQHQQRQHLSSAISGGIVRPPPPEYKAAQAQLIHSVGQHPRLTGPIRRLNQQTIPPSGPMMRPQISQQSSGIHATTNSMYPGNGVVNITPGTGILPGGMNTIGGMHQMQQKLGYPRANNSRSPNVNLGPPDGLGNSISSRGSNSNWQHLFIQQQQQHHQGNFGVGGGNNIHMNATQMQHQQLLRSQMNGPTMNTSLHQQMAVPQQQTQQISNQMGMQLQMSQTQSMTTVSSNNSNGTSMHPHHYTTASPSARGTLQNHVLSQQQQSADSTSNAPDLGFDFLDNLQAGDTSNFNPQELLNSLDSGFNLDSIL